MHIEVVYFDVLLFSCITGV